LFARRIDGTAKSQQIIMTDEQKSSHNTCDYELNFAHSYIDRQQLIVLELTDDNYKKNERQRNFCSYRNGSEIGCTNILR